MAAAKGLLLDLKGVLYEGDAALPGAVETVAALRDQGLAIRFLTNTTTRARAAIAERLDDLGFAIEPETIFSPALAARRILERDGLRRLHLATVPGLAADFDGFELVDDKPQAVVMGDLGDGFTRERLDTLFRMLLAGPHLVALHKNRYCRTDGRLALDLGPFVAALEYASGTTAELVGKPSRAFFSMALQDMGLDAGDVVMVGDDIEADIGGGRDAGLRTVQVRTGKYSDRDNRHKTIKPDTRLNAIADLPGWLAREG